MKYLLILFLFLSACVTIEDFKTGALDCHHAVSTQLMGTAQVVNCENAGKSVYVNSFPGTAIIDPIEKAAEAGAIIGGASVIAQPRLNDSVHVHVGP